MKKWEQERDWGNIKLRNWKKNTKLSFLTNKDIEKGRKKKVGKKF